MRLSTADIAALPLAAALFEWDGALTVGDKEYQAGDPVICLTNDRRRGITNGTRGVVTAVDLEHATLVLRRADGRELTIDTAGYDAIDRGYALTVHKAQGMTADAALVVGSDGATREWAYTAMSRASTATHYYEVERPPERDRLGVHHTTEVPASVEERISRSWGRSVQNDSALDYPALYEKRELQRSPIAARLEGQATEAQIVVLADLGVEFPHGASWVEASLEIDRCLGRMPGRQVRSWLRELGVSDDAALALIRRIDGPHTRAAVTHELHRTLMDAAPTPLTAAMRNRSAHHDLTRDAAPHVAPAISTI